MKLLLTAAVLMPSVAMAQAVVPVVVAPATIDLTGVAVSIIAGIFGVLGVVIPFWLQGHIKDQDAAVTLNNAVKNSLGAIQQAATTAVETLKPSVPIPGVAASLTPGVQYVLDHAGDEMKRLNITPAAVADKIDAQIGLAKIAASGSSPAVPVLVPAAPPAPVVPIPPVLPPAVVPFVPGTAASTNAAQSQAQAAAQNAVPQQQVNQATQ